MTLALSSVLIIGCSSSDEDNGRTEAASEIRRIVKLQSTEVAAVGLDFPHTDERFLYVHENGQWRCVNASGAIALGEALNGLVTDLTAATGLARDVRPERLAAYGFDDNSPRITLFGVDWRTKDDRDELALFTLGDEVEGRRSYLRTEGEQRVFEIDQLPARRFARTADDRLPPMLDRRMLAGEWPNPSGGFTRAFIDFTDGRSMELARDASSRTYAWEWRKPDAQPLQVLPYRIAGWQSYVYRAPYIGFAASTEADRLGLGPEAVWLRITLVDDDESIALEVAEPSASRPLAVRNSKTGMIVLLAPGSEELLVPSDGDLLDRGRVNRWESWLGSGATRK